MGLSTRRRFAAPDPAAWHAARYPVITGAGMTGNWWSAVLRRDLEPQSAIIITFRPVLLPQDGFSVAGLAEAFVCMDNSDPRNSAIWSDADPYGVPPRFAGPFSTAEEAEHAAWECANEALLNPAAHGWNGLAGDGSNWEVH